MRLKVYERSNQQSGEVLQNKREFFFASDTSDWSLISRIYKELKN